MAIRALRAVADSGTLMRAEDLATAIGATVPFVLHVVTPLSKAGWVESQRGPNGGYRLNVSTAGISMLDVIEATEGPMDSTRCVLRGGPCSAPEPCAIHAAWESAGRALLDELAAAPVTPLTKARSNQ